MKLTTLKGTKPLSLALNDYLIDWTGRQVSKPQQKVKDFLFPFFEHDHVLEEFRIPGSKLRIDIFNISRKLVIEVSPKHHFTFSEFLHQGHRLNFLSQQKRDLEKENWVERNGLSFVVLTDEDLKCLTKELFETKFQITL